MLPLARVFVGVASDVLRLVVSFLRPSSAIRAENLVLRKQLASYVERGIKPRRMDHATRVSLALFSRMCDWRTAVVNVRPSTMIRWHRMGWRIFWCRKCRAGRLWSAIIRAAGTSVSERLQPRADSGMMSACCSWREHSSESPADLLRLVVSFLRSSSAIRAENLVLRRQLARYIERGIKPRRVDHATRVSLALFTRLFDWRDAVVIVRPATIVRWHRMGWRIFWRWKCRAGRPPIPPELRSLIRRMAAENPLWGEERIANELLVKLGIRVSPRTVGKYMPKRPPGQPRGDQRWSTFLKNHAKAILACDFFVAVTATFRMLYVFVVIEHGTRRLAHVNVTAHPSADWTLQQLREVVGDEGGASVPDP